MKPMKCNLKYHRILQKESLAMVPFDKAENSSYVVMIPNRIFAMTIKLICEE